ncbi:minor tail protein [Gordonia phage Neville]|uniref:Minor tail protein n=2 Tax=Nevillevirus TaxID=3044773 RepID=A0A515MGY9_9CAUD|nr:minor tail protein [Gordonia phage Neville]YP_010246015.1 minor tail protein [Gordonia phage Trax]AXQ64402.1 minor tail protein [Gordonia phage Neville]QDM55917.1 minor tail protein [Gordonia phage Trax]
MPVVPNGFSGLTMPNNTFGVGAGGAQRVKFENRSQSTVEGILKSDHKPGIDENFGGFNTGLIGVLQRVLMGTGGGGPLSAGLAWLRDLMGQRWKQADETAESVVSVGTQIHYVTEVIALQSGMGVHETGPDRTGTPSFPFSLLNLHTHQMDFRTGSTDSHTHAVIGSTTAMVTPTVNVTAAYAPWGNVIFKSAAQRKVITFLAYRTGTVSSFNVDVYKLEADGSSSIVYSSPNLAGNLTTTIAWQQHLMDNGINADMGDSYDVQFRMTGSGSVSLAGLNFPNPTPLPGFRPYASGSGRNPTSIPVPATIPVIERDAMYVGPTPFVSLGIDVGQASIPRFVFDDFNRASFGNRWITYGPIEISSNRVQHSGSFLDNNSGAAMYAQPMASDAIEVSADIFVDTHAAGIGLCMAQGMTGGVWVAVEDNNSEFRGVRIQTGHYDSRTSRASLPMTAAPASGRYTLRYDPSDNTYRVYFGNPDGAEPILTWTDTGNIVPHGIGRRWVGVFARRAFTNVGGRVDNFTAADIVAD